MSKNRLTFSEEEYASLLKKISKEKDEPYKSPSEIKSSSKKNGKIKVETLPLKDAKNVELTHLLALNMPEKTKKRGGVNEKPILSSIENCKITVEHSANHISIYFDGLRLFSLNEMFALLQSRKFIVFKYKKMLHTLATQAISQIPIKEIPFFDEPCHITLYRSGKKMIDRDNFESMFKALIDGLKKGKNKLGTISDDNPNILFSDTKIQSIGEPAIGIRIEKIIPAPKIETVQSPEVLFNNKKIIKK